MMTKWAFLSVALMCLGLNSCFLNTASGEEGCGQGASSSDAEADSDGDGTPNCIDACPYDAEKTEPGHCGCGVVDGECNYATVSFSIDTQTIKRDISTSPFGINFNYLRDDNSLRPDAAPIQSVLRGVNPGFIRYPGGEMSDWYLWSEYPWDQPAPQVVGWYGNHAQDVLDFDEYMSYVQDIGANPFVVVGYDRENRTGVSRATYRENAVQWVRYANETKKYNVKYWEIGNENWHSNRIPAREMANVVVEFSKAMKAVDPTIKIGASGNGGNWTKEFLSVAAPHIDFVTVSNYNCTGFGSYDHFATESRINLVQHAQGALRAVRDRVPQHAGRLKVVIAEFNAIDWDQNGWDPANDLGHALVIFDTIGQVVNNSNILFGLQWMTRWLDDAGPYNLAYAFGRKNELLAVGQPLKLWGMYPGDQFLARAETQPVIMYAKKDSSSGRKVVYLLNKSKSRMRARVTMLPPGSGLRFNAFVFTGKNELDTEPYLVALPDVECQGSDCSVLLEPVSIHILTTP